MRLGSEKYWKLKMSPEDKKSLERLKTLKIKDGLPEDLKVAILTFLEQAYIIGEYDLPHMPPEYMESLLKTLAKYPEHNMMTLSLIQILKREDLL